MRWGDDRRRRCRVIGISPVARVAIMDKAGEELDDRVYADHGRTGEARYCRTQLAPARKMGVGPRIARKA